MRHPRHVSRRRFLETAGVTAGALMAAGPFAHPARGGVGSPSEKIDIASSLPPHRGGLHEIHWAPRVNPSLIRRLYEADARGIADDELIDAAGYALQARCRSILLATEAHERGMVACPRCGHVIVRPPGVSIKGVLIACDSCAWSVRGCDYLKTYQGKHLHGGGAVALFEEFIEEFGLARLTRERLLAIDRLIHGFHWVSPSPGRIAATNLIYAKNRRELLTFLDALPYGEGSTPGLRENKEEWERLLARSSQPAESGFLTNRRTGVSG